jgi:hypothetical protein
MHDGFRRHTLIVISVIEDPLLSFSKICSRRLSSRLRTVQVYFMLFPCWREICLRELGKVENTHIKVLTVLTTMPEHPRHNSSSCHLSDRQMKLYIKACYSIWH